MFAISIYYPGAKAWNEKQFGQDKSSIFIFLGISSPGLYIYLYI